jgi:hypothetical protein
MNPLNIVVVHFQPLELYPPIQNLIRTWPERDDLKLTVLTTGESTEMGVRLFESKKRNVTINRIARVGSGLPSWRRYLNYFHFYVGSMALLRRTRPHKVLYFETLSSLPVYVYRRFVETSAEIFIHYHEYTTPGEYRNGMMLSRFFHALEPWLYARATWISHTNSDRLKRFAGDVGMNTLIGHVMPNYPPRSWHRAERPTGSPVRIVYVGSLSLETMYTSEFAYWVMRQGGNCIWDIYSLMPTNDAKTFIESLASGFIRLHTGVDYDELPSVLEKYDVGVVLYKGHIPNYVMNAPNKLFEYHTCGLDVWFPEVMIGSLPYVTQRIYPKIINVDFGNLPSFNFNEALTRIGCRYSLQSFSCEDALKPLLEEMTRKDESL